MIGIMPSKFVTTNHGKNLRRITTTQLLEPGTIVHGSIMNVSHPIRTHIEFPPCVMGEKIQVEGWHCVPCCPDVEYESSGKVTWSVELESLKFLLNLRWISAKGDRSKAPIKSLTQIKDSRFVYQDADNKFLVVVEGTQPLGKAASSSGQSSVTNSYSCEVCHKFQGDRKSMRQHQAGHDLQSKKE
jgi:hypothetical protein